MTDMLVLLAQEVPVPEGLGNSGTVMIALLVAMVVMTVVSSRTQKKDREKLRQWVNSLERNQKVVTKGGIHGKVDAVKDDVVVLKIDDDKGTRMTVGKDAIVGVPDSAEKGS